MGECKCQLGTERREEFTGQVGPSWSFRAAGKIYTYEREVEAALCTRWRQKGCSNSYDKHESAGGHKRKPFVSFCFLFHPSSFSRSLLCCSAHAFQHLIFFLCFATSTIFLLLYSASNRFWTLFQCGRCL